MKIRRFEYSSCHCSLCAKLCCCNVIRAKTLKQKSYGLSCLTCLCWWWAGSESLTNVMAWNSTQFCTAVGLSNAPELATLLHYFPWWIGWLNTSKRVGLPCVSQIRKVLQLMVVCLNNVWQCLKQVFAKSASNCQSCYSDKQGSWIQEQSSAW